MSNPSLADNMVHTLGEIQRILDDVDNENPARHTLRTLKCLAEKSITDGIELAQQITDTANQLKRDTKVKI